MRKIIRRTCALLGTAVFTIVTATIPVLAQDGGGSGAGYTNGDPSLSLPFLGQDSKNGTTKQRSTSQRRATQAREKSRAVRGRSRRSSKRQSIETAASGLPPASETRYINDEIVVRFARTSSIAARNQLIRTLGLQYLETASFILAGVTVHRYRVSGQSVRNAITSLERNRAVVTAQPNYLYTLQQETTSQKLKQYAIERLGISNVHSISTGKGARIAIIDSAIFSSHPEISKISLEIHDVSDAGGKNNNAHGTSMAGIIAANGKLTGVAPSAHLIGIAAFAQTPNGKTYGNSWTISKALNIAFDRQAKILNLSFAGPPDPLIKRGMDGAYRRHMLPIAAAGNEGPTASPLYPAAYDTVFAITATDTKNDIYTHANQGNHIAFSAPGVQIVSLGGANGFTVLSGTSLSTAYLSGMAALLVSQRRTITHRQFQEQLQNNTHDLGVEGRDSVFGYGLPMTERIITSPLN